MSTSCPSSPLAAWFVRRQDGGLRLTMNEAVLARPGEQEWATSWFRLHGLARAEPFGVLTVAELAESAPYVIGYHHPALTT